MPHQNQNQALNVLKARAEQFFPPRHLIPQVEPSINVLMSGVMEVSVPMEQEERI